MDLDRIVMSLNQFLLTFLHDHLCKLVSFRETLELFLLCLSPWMMRERERERERERRKCVVSFELFLLLSFVPMAMDIYDFHLVIGLCMLAS